MYTLINHYTDAKDIWDNVKMLLEGSELMKDERESQLYDDFEHFRQNKGETIHEYCVRFMTAIKLNRGLKTSNYDQMYAYLKQHEAHANKNKMVLERYNQHAIDPFTFVSNVSPLVDKTEFKGTIAAGNGKTMHSSKSTTEFKILQRQDVVDASLREWSDLALKVDNVFQADQCDAFDSDVDEAPTVHDNAVQVVLSNVSFVPNDALMMIINDIHEQAAQCVSANEQNKVVNESLTA
ncbi:hypothetical protein Tco_1151910 [Tanacetum coccineum]